MAFEDWFSPQQPADLGTFNYQSEADKVKRKRALALSLMEAKAPQGQMVAGGPAGFYVAPSKGALLASLLTKGLGVYGDRNADTMQSDVDNNSQAALAYQLAHMQDGKTVTRDAGYSAAKDSQAANTIEAGQQVDQNAAVSYPVAEQAPANAVDLPASPVGSVSPAAKAVVAKALSSGGATGSWDEAPKGSDARGIDRRNREAMAARILGDQGEAAGGGRGFVNPPLATQPQPTPVLPPQAGIRPALPPTTVGTSGNPVMTPPSPVQQPDPALPQPPMDPAAVIAAANPGGQVTETQGPSQAELIARLSKLAQTGPMGARVAEAQMNQMFSSKNGRFTTTVHADPVNGGFVQVTTDTQTGKSSVDPINANGSGRPKIIGETTGATGERLNRHADGSTSPMVDGAGKPVRDPNVVEKLGKLGADADAAIRIGEDLKQSLNKLTSIDPKTGKPVIDATSGLGGQLSLAYNTITRDPTKASQAQAEVDGLKSKVFLYGMAKIKSAGGGAGAANSDAEGKRLETALGNLDIGRLGTAGFISAANEIIAGIDARAAQIDAQAGSQGAPLTTRTPGSAPSPMSYDAFKSGAR